MLIPIAMKVNQAFSIFSLIVLITLLLGCVQTQNETNLAQETQTTPPAQETQNTQPQTDPEVTAYLEYDSKINWFKIKYPAD